jgi:hypothetical protein
MVYGEWLVCEKPFANCTLCSSDRSWRGRGATDVTGSAQLKSLFPSRPEGRLVVKPRSEAVDHSRHHCLSFSSLRVLKCANNFCFSHSVQQTEVFRTPAEAFVVLGDSGIRDKVGEEFWHQLVRPCPRNLKGVTLRADLSPELRQPVSTWPTISHTTQPPARTS